MDLSPALIKTYCNYKGRSTHADPLLLLFFVEVKLYVIVVPCAIGIVVVSLIVAAVVFMYRRISASGVGHPTMQMSLLNEADHFSTTQISEVDTHNEANLPVYRPTTQQIAKTA